MKFSKNLKTAPPCILELVWKSKSIIFFSNFVTYSPLKFFELDLGNYYVLPLFDLLTLFESINVFKSRFEDGPFLKKNEIFCKWSSSKFHITVDLMMYIVTKCIRYTQLNMNM